MLIAALFIIAPKWKQSKCLLTDEWIQQSIHKMEQFSAIKREEVSINATTWIKLESIMLSGEKVTKAYILHDFISMKCPEQANPQRQEVGQRFKRQKREENGE